MKRIALTLIGAASLALPALMLGCSNGPNDVLTGSDGPVATDPSSAAAPNNTFDHPNVSGAGGEQGVTGGGNVNDDPGSPVPAAKYHGCAKLTYAALGSILTTRGAKSTATNSALAIYKGGGPALGIANYSGRVPEAIIASTSAMAKQFDIFVAASSEIQTNAGTTTACQGVTIADQTGAFTKDGLSCLMGKLATDEHVAVANQAVQDAVKGGATQAQGIQIAIAAVLEAAHTCE